MVTPETTCENKMFVCEEPGCGREFGKRDTFTRHKHEHTDRYKCEVCGSRFSGMKPLKQHNCERRLRKQREAEMPKIPKVKRTYRKRKMNDVDNLSEDKEQEDDDDLDMLICEVCKKYFASKESLENHKSQCGKQKESKEEEMSVMEGKKQEVEITMTVAPEDQDINILQQRHPGISFIPKIKTEL